MRISDWSSDVCSSDLQLTALDEDIGQSIQDQMFIFDNLLSLDDRSMQTLLRSVENPLLVAALKGADERMRTKMLSAMSQRAAQTVQDEIEGRGPMRVSEVQDAQKRILDIARQLGTRGAIMLGDRKRVAWGKRVSVRVDSGGGHSINTNKKR